MDKYNVILDFTHFDMPLLWKIAEIRKESPQAFYDEIQNISFYFMYPYSILSKSRTNRSFVPYESIESDVDKFEDNEIKLIFEFENVSLMPDDFQDKYSNMVLSMAEKLNPAVVIFNTKLAEYIKKTYPKIKTVQSEIQRSIDIKPNFDMNIIDYLSYKQNKDKLKDKSSYILWVNSFCQNSYKCTDFYSNNKLNYTIDKDFKCDNRVKTFEDMKKNDLFVSHEEIEKINSEGIENFFVKSNCYEKFEILETYLYYVFKPEYKDVYRLKIIKECFMGR